VRHILKRGKSPPEALRGCAAGSDMEAIKKPAGAGYILFYAAYFANGGNIYDGVNNNAVNYKKVKSCHGCTSYFVDFINSIKTAINKSGIIKNIILLYPPGLR
jgi:hypothetical protein